MGSKAKIDGDLLDNIQSLTERRSNGLESVLWDGESQKLSGQAPVGFIGSEAKS